MALTKEQIKKFEKEESEAEDYWALESVAVNLIDVDKEWAKEVFKKAEAKAYESSELHALACSLRLHLKNKEWAKKVYKKAEAKAEEYKLTALADTIYENLDDKEWEKKV